MKKYLTKKAKGLKTFVKHFCKSKCAKENNAPIGKTDLLEKVRLIMQASTLGSYLKLY